MRKSCYDTAIQLLEELLATLYQKVCPPIDLQSASTLFSKYIRSLILVRDLKLSNREEEPFLPAASLICRVQCNTISRF